MPVGFLLALVTGAHGAPSPAPLVFVSGKAITFRSPHGAFICPLPKDWVGSDHGTTLFLERPKSCSVQGYPSSERNYRGSPANRRIEVFYWYWMGEDEPPTRCQQRGTMVLMGRKRPLCKIRESGALKFWSQARYQADTDAAISISLVTRPSTMAQDLRMFRNWAATVKPCRVRWSDSNGKHGAYGQAPDCPKAGVFF